MYTEWSFFRATLNNAELALAKADMGIAGEYAGLVEHAESLAKISAMISEEYQRTQAALLTIMREVTSAMVSTSTKPLAARV